MSLNLFPPFLVTSHNAVHTFLTLSDRQLCSLCVCVWGGVCAHFICSIGHVTVQVADFCSCVLFIYVFKQTLFLQNRAGHQQLLDLPENSLHHLQVLHTHSTTALKE